MDLVAGATRSFFVTGNDNFLLQKRFAKDYIAVGEDDIGLVGYWSKTKNRARKGIKSSKTSQEREENWSKTKDKRRKAPRNAMLLEQDKEQGKKSSKERRVIGAKQGKGKEKFQSKSVNSQVL